MKLRTLLVLSAALALTVGVAAAAAATITVSYSACIFSNGGQVTVPAGTDVTVRMGIAYAKRGLVQSFIDDQTTTATVNGTPSDVSSGWMAPVAVADLYVTFLEVPGATLANPGDSVVVGLQITLGHKHPAGKDPTTNKQLFSGPGDILPNATCTITAT